MHEAHGQQHQIGLHLEGGTGHLFHGHPAGDAVLHPGHAGAGKRLDVAVAIIIEGLGGDGPVALAPLIVRAGGTQLHRPIGPGQQAILMLGRLGHQLELGDGGRALPVRGPHAVRPGVATADHHHVLAGGTQLVGQRVAGHHAILQRQELHGEMHTLQLTPRDGQVARHFRATGQHDGIEALQQLAGRHRAGGQVADHAREVAGDGHAGTELHALGLQLAHAPIDQRLVQLEVGDAVAQQPADAVILLEHGDRMAGTCQLLGTGQP